MDSHIFRRGRWIIDLNETDAINHLTSIKISQDVRLIMEYFLYLLYVETSNLGVNEFSERHKEVKDAIIDVLSGRYDAGARHFSAVIEGVVKKSLLNDQCIDDSTPYPKWTGTFHEHPEPRNFFQLLEGALRDPRSRIGRVIDYPPEEEIFHVSEMIRNPLAHGSSTVGTLEDYKVLFFLLILLFHDIVNPHNYPGNHKYLKWVDRTRTNMRLGGEEPTLDKLLELGGGQGLDLDSIRKAFG
jgi:hypothetical protein